MIRLCVSCRTRRPQKALVPFHRGEKNELLLGAGTRSAWVCPTKGCLMRLTQRPHLASRSIREKGFHANTCLEQVQYKNKCDISTHLRSSLQSGVVYSGRAKVLNNQHKIDFLIVSSKPSISSHTLDVVQRLSSKTKIFYLNISPEILGSWIKKGKRKMIGLSQNSHSMRLFHSLQQHTLLR